MPLSFDRISVGSCWERKDLADLWGYRSFHALARGVFKPSGDNKIILFVKEQKRAEDVQYEDRLDGPLLHWHGEAGHGSDDRIARAAQSDDEIHVFYRRTHRDPFRYLGQVEIVEADLQAKRPSRFVFRLKTSD